MVEKLQGEIDLLQKDLSSAHSQIRDSAIELESARRESTDASARLTELEGKLAENSVTIDELKEKLSAARQDLSRAGSDNLQDHTAIYKLEAELSELRDHVDFVESELECQKENNRRQCEEMAENERKYAERDETLKCANEEVLKGLYEIKEQEDEHLET